MAPIPDFSDTELQAVPGAHCGATAGQFCR